MRGEKLAELIIDEKYYNTLATLLLPHRVSLPPKSRHAAWMHVGFWGTARKQKATAKTQHIELT